MKKIIFSITLSLITTFSFSQEVEKVQLNDSTSFNIVDSSIILFDNNLKKHKLFNELNNVSNFSLKKFIIYSCIDSYIEKQPTEINNNTFTSQEVKIFNKNNKILVNTTLFSSNKPYTCIGIIQKDPDGRLMYHKQ